MARCARWCSPPRARPRCGTWSGKQRPTTQRSGNGSARCYRAPIRRTTGGCCRTCWAPWTCAATTPPTGRSWTRSSCFAATQIVGVALRWTWHADEPGPYYPAGARSPPPRRRRQPHRINLAVPALRPGPLRPLPTPAPPIRYTHPTAAAPGPATDSPGSRGPRPAAGAGPTPPRRTGPTCSCTRSTATSRWQPLLVAKLQALSSWPPPSLQLGGA